MSAGEDRRGGTGGVGGATGLRSVGQPLWVAPLVLLMVATIGLLIIFVGYLYLRVDRLTLADQEPSDFMTSFENGTSSTAIASTLPPPPAVAAPPEDAQASTAAIVDVYQRVFTQGIPQEVRDVLIFDPAAIEGSLAGFAGTTCATDTVAVVTQVAFTSADSASIDFRFEGPNVPDIGRNFIFSGGAARQPGGPWQVTADGINSVVNLAGGYCS